MIPQWFQLLVLPTDDAGTSAHKSAFLDNLPQESFPEVGLLGQRAGTCLGSQWTLPSSSQNTAGHLPLRVLVISAEADMCWVGPCAGQASPFSPWVTEEETASGGERSTPWAQSCRRRVGLEFWGVGHCGVVFSVGLEVIQDWVTVMS